MEKKEKKKKEKEEKKEEKRDTLKQDTQKSTGGGQGSSDGKVGVNTTTVSEGPVMPGDIETDTPDKETEPILQDKSGDSKTEDKKKKAKEKEKEKSSTQDQTLNVGPGTAGAPGPESSATPGGPVSLDPVPNLPNPAERFEPQNEDFEVPGIPAPVTGVPYRTQSVHGVPKSFLKPLEMVGRIPRPTMPRQFTYKIGSIQFQNDTRLALIKLEMEVLEKYTVIYRAGSGEDTYDELLALRSRPLGLNLDESHQKLDNAGIREVQTWKRENLGTRVYDATAEGKIRREKVYDFAFDLEEYRLIMDLSYREKQLRLNFPDTATGVANYHRFLSAALNSELYYVEPLSQIRNYVFNYKTFMLNRDLGFDSNIYDRVVDLNRDPFAAIVLGMTTDVIREQFNLPMDQGSYDEKALIQGMGLRVGDITNVQDLARNFTTDKASQFLIDILRINLFSEVARLYYPIDFTTFSLPVLVEIIMLMVLAPAWLFERSTRIAMRNYVAYWFLPALGQNYVNRVAIRIADMTGRNGEPRDYLSEAVRRGSIRPHAVATFFGASETDGWGNNGDTGSADIPDDVGPFLNRREVYHPYIFGREYETGATDRWVAFTEMATYLRETQGNLIFDGNRRSQHGRAFQLILGAALTREENHGYGGQLARKD